MDWREWFFYYCKVGVWGVKKSEAVGRGIRFGVCGAWLTIVLFEQFIDYTVITQFVLWCDHCSRGIFLYFNLFISVETSLQSVCLFEHNNYVVRIIVKELEKVRRVRLTLTTDIYPWINIFKVVGSCLVKQSKSAKTQPMTEMEIVIKGETFPVDRNIPGDSCNLHYLSFLLVVQNENYIQFIICAVNHLFNQPNSSFILYLSSYYAVFIDTIIVVCFLIGPRNFLSFRIELLRPREG